MHKKGFLLILFAVSIFGILYINSSEWFRLRQAAFYGDRGEQSKEARTYKKILRKQLVVGTYGEENNKEVAGYLLELIRESLKENTDLAQRYLNGKNGNEDASFHKGMAQLIKNDALYREYTPVLSIVLPREWENINSEIRKNKLSLCLNIAESYIEEGNLDKARDFLTEEIVVYYNPFELLKQLKSHYSVNSVIKNKIWGEYIYIVIENFKDIKSTLLTSWASNTKSKIENHAISTGEGFRGASCSEYFKISYASPGYDYWAFSVNFPLTIESDSVGLRVYVKRKEISKGSMVINVIYPRSKRSAVIRSDESRILEDGWRELLIKDIYKKSKTIADENNWGTENMYIDRIGFDTIGYSDIIYIDNFEMFI